jgi:hypothetical protein
VARTDGDEVTSMNVATEAQWKGGDPVPLESVIEQHRRLVGAHVQVEIRERVARALLPSTLEDLVPTLAYLCHDPEERVRRLSRQTLENVPQEELLDIIRRQRDTSILDTLARVLPAQLESTRQIVLNRATSNQTLVHLASIGDVRLCERIGRNAVRCLAHPATIEALYYNPQAGQALVQGLLELAVREDIRLEHIPGFVEAQRAVHGSALEKGQDKVGLSDIEFLTALNLAGDRRQVAAVPAAEEEEKKESRNLATLIGEMSVAQKVRLALVGDANARKILIRDPKKMIALAVLKSPRLTDGEIRVFATNKNLAEEVITQICRRRAWTRDYAIRRALAKNPKTPVGLALAFLRSLNKRDIKSFSKSREVPATIARMAGAIIAKEENKRKKRKKK